MALTVRMNDVGQANGSVEIKLNGERKLYYDKVNYRTKPGESVDAAGFGNASMANMHSIHIAPFDGEGAKRPADRFRSCLTVDRTTSWETLNSARMVIPIPVLAYGEAQHGVACILWQAPHGAIGAVACMPVTACIASLPRQQGRRSLAGSATHVLLTLSSPPTTHHPLPTTH